MTEIYLVNIKHIKTPEALKTNWFIYVDAKKSDDPYYDVIRCALREFRKITTDDIFAIEILSDNVKKNELSSDIPFCDYEGLYEFEKK